MLFRPLCVDHRQRAQEVLLIEREEEARCAAACFLEHRSTIGTGGTIGDTDRRQLAKAGSSAESTEEESTCRAAASCINSQDSNSSSFSHGSPDDSRATDINGQSKLSLSQIYNLLGPAIHPSECSLRTIAMRGPICCKDNKVIESKTLRLLGLDEDSEEREVKNVVSALESGASRFNEPLLIDEDQTKDNVTEQNEMIELEEDIFRESMLVFYSKEKNISPDSMELPRRTRARSVVAPLFLRHGPPSLVGVQQLKNLRRRGDDASFASVLIDMFQPELPSLAVNFQDDSPRLHRRSNDVYTGPKFDPVAYCDVNLPACDCTTREETGSFINFSIEAKENLDDSSNSGEYKPPSSVLEVLDENTAFIRMDPNLPSGDIESLGDTNSTFSEIELRLTLERVSASSILTKLNLPARFERGHGVSQDLMLKAVDGPRFQFLQDAMTHDMPLSGTSFDPCLRFIESRDVSAAESFVPRKISLESTIKLPEEHEVDTNDKPSITKLLSKLPSYSSQVSFAPKLTEKGRSRQRCHVKSSARVSEAQSLKRLVGTNDAASLLFLPQVKIPKTKLSNITRKHSSENVAIVRLVRSLPSGNTSRDLEMLQQYNSDYPIENWSSSNGTGMLPNRQSEPNRTLEDNEVIMNKRAAFCEKAAVASNRETQRTMILTGCSARRNAVSVFIYRGILTNQPVDPQIYQARYASMLIRNKSARLSDASQPSFVEMVQNYMVDSLLRAGKKKKRGAQLASHLKTARRGMLQVVREKELTQLDPRCEPLSLTHVHNLAVAGRDLASGLSDIAIEELGETSKKERGELLHLVSKAGELEKEEMAYLEELAVLNRQTKATKDDLFDFTIEPAKKRKQPLEQSEVDERRRKKKKNKKEKRRNETSEERAARKDAKMKRKEERKRKSKNSKLTEDLVDTTKKTKIGLETQDSMNVETVTDGSSFFPSARGTFQVTVPSVQLGVTPIVPPKKPLAVATVQKKRVHQVKNTELGSAAVSHKIKDSTLVFTATSKSSPDSVASLHEGRKLFPSQKKHTTEDLVSMVEGIDGEDLSLEKKHDGSNFFVDSKTDAFDNGSHVSTLVELQDSAKRKPQDDKYEETGSRRSHELQFGLPEDESVIKGYNNGEPTSLEDTHTIESITLLSSESFLENFSEVVADLASGRWTRTLAPHEKNKVQSLTSTRVAICDCPLVDLVGVDAELSEDKGLVVQRLSSWLDNDGSIQKASRAFIKKIVQMAASGRYRCLHVILCVDIDVTSAVSSEFVTLQNALCQQQTGCHCDKVTFEFVRKRVLSATLALHLISNQTIARGIVDFASDDKTVERARFLLMLVPSMTVQMGLKCLGLSEEHVASHQSGDAMYGLLHSAKVMSRKGFVDKTSSIISDISAEQLWLAMHVQLSHTH